MRLISAFMVLGVAIGTAYGAEQKVADPAGKAIGVILDCNSCKDPSSGKDCASGVEDGFHDGKRCGKCLIEANFGTKLLYANDLWMTGTLLDKDGAPLKDQFIRLFLPNTWTVRTRSSAQGFFRLLLGATLDRQGEPIKVDLGKRTRLKDGSEGDYALYMLPLDYKPCVSK